MRSLPTWPRKLRSCRRGQRRGECSRARFVRSSAGMRVKNFQYARSRCALPTATAAAFQTPAETPRHIAGRTPSSSSASTTPTWKMLRDEPPEKRRPIRFAPRRRSSIVSILSAPQPVRHKSGKKDGIADGAVPRRLHDRGDDHGPARQREDCRRYWMSGRAELARAVAAAEDEERRAGEAEEDEVDGDDVAEDLLVRPAERDDDGDDALQHDGDGRHARRLADAADGAEEDAVLRHGVVDARRGEHALAEEAERGDGDAGGDEARAARAEGRAHHGGRRGGGARDPPGPGGPR